MKFQAAFKPPDGVSYCKDQFLQSYLRAKLRQDLVGLSEQDILVPLFPVLPVNRIKEIREEALQEMEDCDKLIESGRLYILRECTIEFDWETRTGRIVEGKNKNED